MKLRTGLFLLVAGSVIPVLLLALVLGSLLIEHERETFRRGAFDRNRAFLSAVDAAMRGHVATLQALSTSSNLEVGNVVAFERRLARILESQPDWQDVILTRADGTRIVDAAHSERGLGIPSADPESLRRAVEERRPVVGNIVRREPSGQWGVAVRFPVVHANEVRYVLSAIVRPEQMQRLIEDQKLPEGWVTGLVDRNQRFVARVPWRAPGGFSSPGFREATAGAPSGWYRGRTVEGSDTFTAFMTSAQTGWVVGLAIPSEVIYATSRRAMSYLALGTAIAMALAFVFAWVVGRRIAGPITALAGDAERLGRGEAPLPRAFRSRIAEVGEVERAMEHAAGAIAERQALREREQAALREADRAKDEFIAMLGHELRNPLSAIATSAHLLRETAPGGRMGTAARDIIERQTRHMTRMVEDLMDISRLTTGKLALVAEPLDLGAVARRVAETWEQSRRMAPGRIRLDLGPAPALGDRSRLEQVVSNLLDNAIKFSPADSPIRLETRTEGEEAVLRVVDEGQGIDPALLAQVFRPFVQGPQDVHRPVGGLGLGLAVVQRLLALHGGRVVARSAGAGQGTTFEVALPLAVAAPEERPKRAEPRLAP